MADQQLGRKPDSVSAPGASDLVILVHGTFAGDESSQDEGNRWWQRGSQPWTWLQAHLPEGVQLPGDGIQLFHWSGANSQVERLKASNELLGLVLELERQGVGYHLVGHSHGGSVIWEALVTAHVTKQDKIVYPDLGKSLHARGLINYRPKSDSRSLKQLAFEEPHPGAGAYGQVASLVELNGLRSWTTVGTPFLRYLPRALPLLPGWPNRRLSLSRPPSPSFDRAESGLLMAFMMSAMTLLMGLAVLAYLPFQRPGWRLQPPFGPALTGALLVLIGTALTLTIVRTVDRFEAGRLILRRESEVRFVFERFASRWLCLWAPTDEAIIGLSSLAPVTSYDYTWLCLPTQYRSRETSLPTAGDAEVIRIPLRLSLPAASLNVTPSATTWRFRRVRAPVYLAINRWLTPRVSKAVSNLTLHTAQGSDIRGVILAYVSPWPLPLNKPCAGLPEQLATRLEKSATEHAAALVPNLRQILVRTALDEIPLQAAVAANGHYLSGRELVHTSYFDDTDVLKLILLHISRSMTRATRVASSERGDHLAEWLQATSAAVAAKFAEFRNNVPD